MEVALEAAALLVARLDDPRRGSLNFGELDTDLDPQARHLDRERRRGEDAVEQVAPLEQRRVVEQHRRAHVVTLDLSLRARSSRGSSCRRSPVVSAYASVSGSQK